MNPAVTVISVTERLGGVVNDSRYLADSSRLGDVIAAIQTMGTYKFYKLGFDEWADRICGDGAQGNHWRKVFTEHPEFFRLDAGRKYASLVIRRQHQKLYDVDARKMISRANFRTLSKEQQSRISRNPLSSNEISALVSAAIELHSRAVDQNRDRRWWLPVLTALIAAVAGIAGTLLGAWLG